MKVVRRKVKAPRGLAPGELRAAEATRKVKLDGWWYTGCPGCGLRFATTRFASKWCADCNQLAGFTVYGRPMWDVASDPIVCCLTSCQLITDVGVLQNYRCGGDTPWWLCSGCSRTHPYNPQDPTRGGRA